MNIKLGKISVGSRTSANRYNTIEYARMLLNVLRRWEQGEHKPMLLPSDNTGMLPKTMRVSFYTARAFIRDNPGAFTAEELELLNSASFEITESPVRGIIVRRRASAFNIADQAMQISRQDQDHKAYQEFMDWISESRELNDRYVIQGPFNMLDYERYKSTAENLRGIYLAELTPLKITFIYHPGGK